MAHSLELRVPYLDKEVWSVARTLTSSQKMKGRHTKRAFRAAAFSHIPSEWANRKKAGFMVPFRVWIKEDKYYAKVLEMFQRDFASELFDTDKLISMLDEHRNGRKKQREENLYRLCFSCVVRAVFCCKLIYPAAAFFCRCFRGKSFGPKFSGAAYVYFDVIRTRRFALPAIGMNLRLGELFAKRKR